MSNSVFACILRDEERQFEIVIVRMKNGKGSLPPLYRENAIGETVV